jgi:hypothetical protein
MVARPTENRSTLFLAALRGAALDFMPKEK